MGVVTCRGLVLWIRSGSLRDSGIIISLDSFRGELGSIGRCSSVVLVVSTGRDQIPHGGS